MKKGTILAFIMFLFSGLMSFSQESKVFKGKIINEEYQVSIEMNLYDQNIIVPGQELLGETAGYLGSKRDPRKWIITIVKSVSSNTARIAFTNDYGSEDLTVSIIFNTDGTFTLRQEHGSPLKIAVSQKWVKLPKSLSFKKLKSDIED